MKAPILTISKLCLSVRLPLPPERIVFKQLEPCKVFTKVIEECNPPEFPPAVRVLILLVSIALSLIHSSFSPIGNTPGSLRDLVAV